MKTGNKYNSLSKFFMNVCRKNFEKFFKQNLTSFIFKVVKIKIVKSSESIDNSELAVDDDSANIANDN